MRTSGRRNRVWSAWPVALALIDSTRMVQAQTPALPAPSAPPSPASPALPPTQLGDLVPYVSDKQAGQETGVPLVTVRLNDTTDGTFMLDTGSSVCAVTDAMAAKLALTPQPVAQVSAPLIMDGGQAQAVPLTIQVGRFRFPRFTTVVIKASRFQEVLGHPLDGILGANLLSHFAVLLQPQRHTLTLITPGRLSADQRRDWGLTRAASLPLTHSSSGTFWAPIALANGTHAAHENLMVDTGAVTSVVSHQAVQDLGLSPEPTTVNVPFGTGTLEGALVRVPTVTLGTVEGATPPTQLTMQNGVFLFPRQADAFGSSPHVLGMNILSRCAVLIDFPGNQITLQPLAVTEVPQVSLP